LQRLGGVVATSETLYIERDGAARWIAATAARAGASSTSASPASAWP
jgi:hypothetical protein